MTLELWGGIECTVNRVGDRYFDQVERSGHARRIDDLDRIAALGIRALRYPVLWERAAPDSPQRVDFAWADARLTRLRELGIRPIVGLLHHGSGPRYTNLLAPGFAEGLARFARAVAERYPWVTDFTPVNEPLTTARFSALYGHWYPHRRDWGSFVRALLNQCRATALAMRAVRSVNPRARLIQTEDLGTIHSTAQLAYQAAFENERRWLGLDLLSGRVGVNHPLYSHLLAGGATPEELGRFVEEPCPPDVLGVNHYVTSDRFLDERLERYPPWSHGGNGRHAYADVEAVRVAREGVSGYRALLVAAHRRYGRPTAITEAHLGGSREEQLRWFSEAVYGAEAAQADGAEVCAVTAWALLGSHDWDCLVVREGGNYEPGSFDVRSEPPRSTALATMVRALTAGRMPDHPVLAMPGWWRRPDRFHYPETGVASTSERPSVASRPILITGASGTLGRALGRVCARRGLAYRLFDRHAMDIADAAAVARAIVHVAPWAVVNAAGYVRVDDAEGDPERVHRENTLGPAILAEACRVHALPLLTFSSDLVFDGLKLSPYVEEDTPGPLGVYGVSKVLAERRVLAICPSALVVRTAAFFSPWDTNNFVTRAIEALAQGRRFVAASDVIVSPTYVPDLANAALDLLIDGECGLWHLANRDAVSWAELAERSARLAGVDAGGLVRCAHHTLGLAAPRPAYSVLGSQRGSLLPPLDHALARYVAEREAA